MRSLVLDVPDVPANSHNLATPAVFATRLGTSGRFIPLPPSDQPFNARTHEFLEVTEVGNHWASVGATGHGLSEKLRPRLGSRSQSPASAPKRARMWKFSLPLLHPDTQRPFADLGRLRSGLQRKSIDRYMWLVHDRDEGSAPHAQGALKLGNSRSREQLSSILGLPATSLQPLVDKSGQHGAFERYCRYLLHEGPEAQADGKARYFDSDAHANFDFREIIDHHFNFASAASAPSADLIKLQVYRGEMTLGEVEAIYPMVFIRHLAKLEALHEKGRREKELAAHRAESAARQQEEERRLLAVKTERARLSDQGFTHEEIDLAIGESLSEEELMKRRSKTEQLEWALRHSQEEASRLQEAAEERERKERESPEYKEKVRLQAEAEERRFTIASLATCLEIKGSSSAREYGVLRAATEGGFTTRDYAPDDVISWKDITAFYADVFDLSHLSPDRIASTIREDIEAFRRDLARAPLQVSSCELQASQGDEEAFQRALKLRKSWGHSPDLVTLPTPRPDLPDKRRALLLAAA